MRERLEKLGQAAQLFLQRLVPKRIPILYVVLTMLVLLSSVPLVFYSRWVTQDNRRELEANERLLQSTITRSLGEEIRLYRRNLLTEIESLVRLLETSGYIEPNCRMARWRRSMPRR